MKACSVEWCKRSYNAKGYCKLHYGRFARNGVLSARVQASNGSHSKWILNHLGYDGDTCLIWPFSKDGNGYARTVIDGRTELVHRVMAIIIHGPMPSPKHQARHLCGNAISGCVAPLHICWGTRSENAADKVLHGTSQHGRKHNYPKKLTESQVLEIWEKLSIGMLKSKIAAEYGVSIRSIYGIEKGQVWSWLTSLDLRHETA